jgi:imidazolonepropionase-like amidohydrolase
MEAMGSRNLPFTAGTAVGHGLPYEAAVKALTGGTAEILGIADRCGTIAEGMDATLFVSTGDALDMRTNNVEHAFIQGRPIDLNDPHKQLFRKYEAKYGE